MSNATSVLVPDIGDFHDIPVIEVLVKPGDMVKKNDPIVTLESEKATMKVPAPQDGLVRAVTVRVGDKVSQGTPLLELAQGSAPTDGSAAASTHDRQATEPAGQNPQAAPTIPSSAAPNAPTLSLVELRVPDMGDFTNVPVIDVLVAPGQAIEKEAPLVALESEKATMEVPASAAGVIRDVRVRVGDRVSEGSVLATIETRATMEPQPTPETPPPAAAQSAVASNGSAIPLSSSRTNGSADAHSNGDVPHASPSIRRYARELGVDLHTVAPSGPNGRITREDVQSFVKRAVSGQAATTNGSAPASLGLAAWPKVDFAQYGEIERKPLTRIQKISGPNLHRNWVMIPHVTQNDEADVTELEAFRKTLNAEGAKNGTKITMLAFLMRASVAALKKFPQFNSSLDGDELVFKRYYNIGFAADTPNGLVVPVVRDADSKGIAELANETAELAAKARDGKLSAGDMQGGTFTISSLGSIGGTTFTPIINAPDVAILGACRAAIRPVWNGSAFEPRFLQPLSLSYDHRVIDGAAAARFTAYLAELLADLRRVLL